MREKFMRKPVLVEAEQQPDHTWFVWDPKGVVAIVPQEVFEAQYEPYGPQPSIIDRRPAVVNKHQGVGA